MIAHIEELLKHETAGDPMTGVKWTRRTTQKVARQLRTIGIQVCARTVAKLLQQLEFSLRVNHKKLSPRAAPPGRNEQFEYIAQVKEAFAHRGWPIISIDTKKKELVGNFKNAGTAWTRLPVLVNDHDFRSDAHGIAVPYGVYEVEANRGSLFIGRSSDTAAFAVDNVVQWWRTQGRRRHPDATRLLILADGGGSNGHRNRAWKQGLQERLCDPYGLTVTCCHYPTGASKWNPIEHRLFAEITTNWAGRPLDSFETIARYARTTQTTTGLKVRAYLVDKTYPKGVKVSDEAMATLRLRPHEVHPERNYTVRPR